MSITKTTKFADRCGLDVTFYAYTDKEQATPLLSVDYANLTNFDIKGETVWATGGRMRSRRIGFNNPMEGTFNLETQIMTPQLLNLKAGNDISEDTTTIKVSDNGMNFMPRYYTIKCECSAQGEDGTVYTEEITIHKACVNRGFTGEHDGSADPQSLTIEFNLLANEDGDILTKVLKDAASAPEGS